MSSVWRACVVQVASCRSSGFVGCRLLVELVCPVSDGVQEGVERGCRGAVPGDDHQSASDDDVGDVADGQGRVGRRECEGGQQRECHEAGASPRGHACWCWAGKAMSEGGRLSWFTSGWT